MESPDGLTRASAVLPYLYDGVRAPRRDRDPDEVDPTPASPVIRTGVVHSSAGGPVAAPSLQIFNNPDYPVVTAAPFQPNHVSTK